MDLDERHIIYDELLEHFSLQIQRYCIRHARSESEVRDLLQEVLAAVWSGVPLLKAKVPSRQANRWLQLVMRHAIVDYFKANPKPKPLPRNIAETIPTDPGGDSDLFDDLSACLDSESLQMLRDYRDGYTYSEMAASRGITNEALRQRMSRLKKKLKTIITDSYERK